LHIYVGFKINCKNGGDMKKLGYTLFLCAVTVVFCFSAQAQPIPGTYVFKNEGDGEAGYWKEFLLGGGEGQAGDQITARLEEIYEFGTEVVNNDNLRRVRLQQVAKLRDPDPSEKDQEEDLPFVVYRTLYNGGQLKLYNNETVGWYNANDSSPFFTATLGITRVLTRKFVEPDPDQADVYIPTEKSAFVLTSVADFGEYPGYKAFIVAWYRGTPVLEDGPEDGLEDAFYYSDLDAVKITICGPLAPEAKIPFIVKPGSCRNPLNIKSQGVLPAVIPGTDDVDFDQIDFIELFVGSNSEPVSPLRWSIEDEVTWNQDKVNKMSVEDYNDDMDDPDKCGNENPDGKKDLILKFDTQAIVARLGDDVADGQQVILRVVVTFKDGSRAEGQDKVELLVKGSKFNREQVKQFIKRFYELCLNRQPEDAGWDGWADALENGSMSGSQVAAGFIFSNEFKKRQVSYEQYLIVLYKAFFDRDPDEGGYNQWLEQLRSGKSQDDIFHGFIYSQEFFSLCDKYGIDPN
jgi:hypothetical protein